ncbi:hypothetical protein H6P81_013357 [Aristolochia fimbriata]|uniref:Cytochrome P450 n=1 Tax=Aristolochia fimbriata TaxID=158543 RepID=A0AAV7EEW4_ARIFI|nr:hypothetical protein H6P81_013357 [Aristolochia fimbriata]
MALLWISLLCVVLGYLLLRRPKSGKCHLTPSPPRLPIIGNLHQLGPQPQRSLQALSQKHGPLLLLYFGSMPVLVASDNDSAQAVLKTHDRVLANRPSLIIPDHIFYKGKDLVFAKYGEYWRQVKKICILHLFSAKQVESFRSVREEEVFLMIENIFKLCSGPVDLSRVFRSTTNNIVSRVALGKKYYEEKQSRGLEFMQLLEELMVLMGAFHIGDIFPSLAWIGKLTGLDARLKRNSKGWNDFLEQVIEDHVTKRRANGEDEGRDFVDVLLEIRETGEMGFPIERDHIKALILDMFVAGTDTTYTVMEWTMAELMRRPAIIKKAQREVRTVSQGNSEVTEKDLPLLPYLKSVIKETLRLHPPVPLLVPREAMQDVEIGEYRVPAKTRVMVNVWAIGRDPKLWEDAEAFKPERFMDAGSIDLIKKHYFRFIPFGAGRRSCPGGPFALTAVELAIANLLNSFEWELPDGELPPGELDMAEACGITLRKKTPLRAVATPFQENVFRI